MSDRPTLEELVAAAGGPKVGRTQASKTRRENMAAMASAWREAGVERMMRQELYERRQMLGTFRENITAGQVDTVVNNHINFPSASNSLKVGAGLLGFDLNNPLGLELAKRDAAAVSSPIANYGQAVRDGFKSQVRNMFVGFESAHTEVLRRPLQAILATAEEDVDALTEGGGPDIRDVAGATMESTTGIARIGAEIGQWLFGDDEAQEEAGEDLSARAQDNPFARIYRNYTQTPESIGVRAARESIAGRPVNLGEGFLPASVDPRETEGYQRAVAEGVSPEEAYRMAEATVGTPITIEERQEREGVEAFGIVNPTPGRVVATALDRVFTFEENTVPFGSGPGYVPGTIIDAGSHENNLVSGLFDFGLAIGADPAYLGAKGVGAIRNMRSLLAPVGHRPTIFRPTVDSWINSRSGRRVAERVAQTTSVEDLRNILRTDDVATLRRFQDASTPDEVVNGLYDHLRFEIPRAPSAPSRVARLRPSTDTRVGRLVDRMGGDMPGFSVSLSNQNEGLATMSNFMRLTRIPRAQREQFLSEWIRLEPGDLDGAYDVVTRMVGAHRDDMIAHGWNPASARTATRMWNREYEQLQSAKSYFETKLGDMPFPGANTAPDGTPLPTAHALLEHLTQTIPLPDGRQIRRSLNGVRRWVDNIPDGAKQAIFKGGDPLNHTWPVQGLRYTLDAVWKPMALLRAAIVSRIGLEEQARMAAAGYDSMFSDPVSWLQYIANRSARGKTDVFGFDLDDVDEFRRAMTREQRWLDAGKSSERGRGMTENAFDVRRPGEDGYFSGWGIEYSQMANDGIARTSVREGVEAAQAQLWESEGLRRTLLGDELMDSKAASDAYVRSLNARAHYVTGGDFTVTLDDAPIAADDLMRRAEADPDIWARVNYRIDRPGNPELLEGMVQGRLGRARLTGPRRHGESTIGKELERRGFEGPDLVKHPIEPSAGQRSGREMFVDYAFSQLMSRPTNYFARAPAFRQMYWQHMKRLAPYMDREAQGMLVSMGRTWRLPDDEIRAMQATFDTARGGTVSRRGGAGVPRARDPQTGKFTERPFSGATPRSLSLGQADEMAKWQALDEVKGLLYDVTKRKNFFEAHPLVFAFGDAWLEILNTWRQLIAQNPGVLRRGQQVIESARDNGWFETDANGEEVFMAPGGDLFALMQGIRPEGELEEGQATIGLKGFVTGLNLVGNLAPGFTPVVSTTVAGMDGVFSDPNMWWLRDLVAPYGAQAVEEPGDVASILMPAWLKKFATAGIPGTDTWGKGIGEWQRLHASSAIDMLRAMNVNGLHNPSNPQETVRRAEEAASAMGVLRGIVQFLAPTGVTPETMVKVGGAEAGTVYALQVLASDYRDILNELDGDETAAMAEFVRRYGVDPMRFTTPKTYEVEPHSVTRAGKAWEVENRDLYERYPATAHFANPEEEAGEFDFGAWAQALDNGWRQNYTPEQWQRVADAAKAQWQYDEKVAKVDQLVEEGEVHSEAADNYKRYIRAILADEYRWGRVNDFDPPPGVPQRHDWTERMKELEEWLSEPRLAATDAGQGLQKYMDARNTLLRRQEEELELVSVDQGGYPRVSTANSAEPIRRYLRAKGDEIIREHPGFRAIYERILRTELGDTE